jgi:hypothetical protein
MSKHDSYYAYQDGKAKWLKDNPGKTARDFEYAGTDVQDQYVDPEMEKRGYTKSRYIGAGAWEWSRS